MNWYHYDSSGDLILKLYIQPGAKKTHVVGFHGDALKIKLSALPIDGKANEHLVKFLAHRFNVLNDQIKIKQGNKSRVKVLVIQKTGLSIEALYCEETGSESK